MKKTHNDFIYSTSSSEWEAYQIGRARANRSMWMAMARQYLDRKSPQAATSSVKAAREENHEYLRSLKAFRATKHRTAACA